MNSNNTMPSIGKKTREENSKDKKIIGGKKKSLGDSKLSGVVKSSKNKKPITKKKRYFERLDSKTGARFGRYAGATPKQAASKAFTKYLKKLKEKGQALPKIPVPIYIRESTRQSAKKVYGYEALLQKLPKPQILKIVNKKTKEVKIIPYNHRNKIKKIAVPDQIGGIDTSKFKKQVKSKKSKKSVEKKPKKKSGSKTAKTAKNAKNAKNTRKEKTTTTSK